VRDDQVNILTVVANETYERYVSQLQQEVVEEFGVEGAAPAPGNARERQKYTAKLRKARLLSPEFRALWEKISRKTRYSVTIDTDQLVEEAGAALSKETVNPPRLVVRKGEVYIGEEGAFAGRAMMGEKPVSYLETTAPLPDLFGLITTILERSSPPTRVSRATLLRVILRAGNIAQAMVNPQEYAARAARILKDALAEQLTNGVRYETVDGWYDTTEFTDEVQSLKELIHTAGSDDEGKSLYDGVAVDSSVEDTFLRELERRPDVLLYVKLPNWFRVDTPVGEYNPDWAIVMRQTDHHGDAYGERLYLVRETKSTLNLKALRDDERRKLVAGSRHFNDTLKGDYKVVTDAAQLPGEGVKP
jgi:type III restriction enzyme